MDVSPAVSRRALFATTGVAAIGGALSIASAPAPAAATGTGTAESYNLVGTNGQDRYRAQMGGVVTALGFGTR